MLTAFSAGYYLDRVAVEPGDVNGPALAMEQYRQAVEAVYGRRLNRRGSEPPLVIKLGHGHLSVRGALEVPIGSLVVPEAVVDRCRIENPPRVVEILIAKADRAAQLLSFEASPRETVPAVP